MADVVILLLLVLGVSRGWSRGGLSILADLAGLVTGLVAALVLYPFLAPLLQGIGLAPHAARLIAFVSIWLGLNVLVGAALASLLAQVPRQALRSLPNRLVGGALGLGKWIVYLGLALLLITASPGLAPLKAQIGDSQTAALIIPPARAAATWAMDALDEPFQRVVGDAAELLTIRPPTEEDPSTVGLGFRVANGRLDPGAEAAMLEMLNRERVAQGLEPLVMDEALRQAARAHSQDMLARGYFGHVTPDGVTPAQRLRRRNILFLVMGENLAFAPTVRVAHQGLMRSPGHRANILRPAFHRVGIGAIDAGIHGTIFTQNFSN